MAMVYVGVLAVLCAFLVGHYVGFCSGMELRERCEREAFRRLA